MDSREWLFDKRVVRRNLDKGVLTWKAHQEYLKTLSNQENGAEALVLETRTRQETATPDGKA
jgi:hypothetical protein